MGFNVLFLVGVLVRLVQLRTLESTHSYSEQMLANMASGGSSEGWWTVLSTVALTIGVLTTLLVQKSARGSTTGQQANKMANRLLPNAEGLWAEDHVLVGLNGRTPQRGESSSSLGKQ